MKKNDLHVITASALALMASVGWCSAEESPSELPGLRGTLAVPVAQEPDSSSLDRSRGQTWHRLSMRITGSMCPACLLELEGKLKQMPGVTFAKIDWRNAGAAPAQNGEAKVEQTNAAPTPAANAEAKDGSPDVGTGSAAPAKSEKEHKHGGTPRSVGTVIVFDSKEMSADALTQLIKRELYKPMDIRETEK